MYGDKSYVKGTTGMRPEQFNELKRFLKEYMICMARESTALLPEGADYMEQTNPDANGFYQTITYKKGGAAGDTVLTVSLTFDAAGNAITYTITYP